MVLKWLKDAVKVVQQRKKKLEKEKERQLALIEKMYDNIEARDALLQKQESGSEHSFFDASSILKFWILGAVVVYFAYIAFKTLDVIYLILAAFVISMIMNAPITFFSKYMNRGLSIALAYFIVLSVLIVILVIILPFIINQLIDIIKILVTQINYFQELVRQHWLQVVIEEYMRLPSLLKEYIISTINSQSLSATLQTNLLDNMSQIISTWTTYASNLGSFAFKLVWWIFTTITQSMILFLLAVFFSIEKENVINFISSLAGTKKHHTYVKLQKMYAKLWLRLKWQLLVCLYVWTMMTILFALFGRIFGIRIPNIWMLWIVAGITNFIPYIWPFIGMTTVWLVAIVSWGRKATLLVLSIYILVNQSENNVLTPIIMNKTLGVSALLTFICMLLWGLVFGFIWILLSVPIAVILTMVFERSDVRIPESSKHHQEEKK